MLTLHDNGTRLCDGLNRREWLRAGSLGLFGLTLPGLMQARAASAAKPVAATGRAKSVILLFCLGGQPQHETWDPKPEAPAEIKGPFQPIASATPGLQVCELMPKTAKLTDKIAVLRAMSTNDNAHSSSGYWMLTGVPHQPMNVENAKPGAPNDWPCVAAMVKKLRPGNGTLPPSVVLPEHIWNDGNISWPGQTGGFLGRTADPWLSICDPNSPNFQLPELGLPAEVPTDRFDDRRSLLQRVNGRLGAIERSGALALYDNQAQQAFDLIRSPQARRAFDLDQEAPAVRDRYGRHKFNQSCLLARRLVEAGVPLVQVNWTRVKDQMPNQGMWDTHSKNADSLKSFLMPVMDQAYSALLEDLSDRGLLDQTLVVLMGEFGRTPKHNAAAGRDHWGHVFSVALAGGGVRGGMVWGASDKIGGHPKDGRVQPQDLTATIFHSLGIRPDTEIHDTQGRPVPISRGEVIRQILL